MPVNWKDTVRYSNIFSSSIGRISFQFPLINGCFLHGKNSYKGIKTLLDLICDKLDAADRASLAEHIRLYSNQRQILETVRAVVSGKIGKKRRKVGRRQVSAVFCIYLAGTFVRDDIFSSVSFYMVINALFQTVKSGEYLKYADRILLLEDYLVSDVTDQIDRSQHPTPSVYRWQHAHPICTPALTK